jgi:cation diffusion facilitator CzcD-associated flavoprotein CzcO
MPTVTDVVVIGAGRVWPGRRLCPAGARHQPLVLEAGPEPAGSWPHYARAAGL